MAEIRAVTNEDFQEAVLEVDGAILVDFWAPWCGPCRMMNPILEELNEAREDLEVVKVDTDANPDLAQTYGIQSIPTMHLFRDGELIKQFVGAMPRAKLEAEIDSALRG